MSTQPRQPKGVPTGGEFATGERPENSDLTPARYSDATVRRVLKAAESKLSYEDAERILVFCGDDESKAADLLREQDRLVHTTPPFTASYYETAEMAGQAMADAGYDMVEAKRLLAHRGRAAEKQRVAEAQAREARMHLRAASAAQIQACASLILARHPDTSKIMLMPGIDEPHMWLVFTDKSTTVLRTHQFGGRGDMIDLNDPADLAALCIGYDKVSGKAEGLRFYTNGTLRDADLDLSWYRTY